MYRKSGIEIHCSTFEILVLPQHDTMAIMEETRKLNKEQKEAIKHRNGPLLIIAGAGTGKTTVITERIVHLIKKQEVNPQNILALTFTEKASQEMVERVDVALPYGYAQM